MSTGLAGKAAGGLAGGLLAATAVFTAGLPDPALATPTGAARVGIPPAYLALYQQAAGRCPGLSWTVLAGVGEVESDHGRAASLVSATGAQGPMQFEPATWSAYGVDGDRDGRADPFDPADAIPAAVDYLCTLGAATDPTSALIAYTCGSTSPACRATAAAYAAQVLGWAARYGQTTATPGPVAAAAVRAALSQLGTPYLWGGDSPAGFDCSGLVQWAYARAGLALPRVAQDQYDTGPPVPPGAPLLAGDLVFFGTDLTHVDHVGIYLGDGRFLDAPHTGATVRIDVLAAFTPRYLAATRPEGNP